MEGGTALGRIGSVGGEALEARVRGALRALWQRWLVVARAVGYVQTLIVTVIMYFIALSPFAVAVRLFTDPLDLKGRPSWRGLHRDPASASGLDAARKQF